MTPDAPGEPDPEPEDTGDGLKVVAVRQPGRDCYKCKGMWKNLPGCVNRGGNAQ